jgi:hypothetical protein
MLPEASHAGQVVFELGELDLELPLGAHCVLGEDVEDELSAIDDAELELVLQAALLSGIEVVVDDEGLRLGRRNCLLQLHELALSHEGAGIGRGTTLHELSDRLHAGRSHELTHLPELVVFVDPLGQNGDEKAALGLGAGRRVRLVLGHALIMPLPRP